MQIPIGAEDNFLGVIDLITEKAYYFDGDNGEKIRVEDCPSELADDLKSYRSEMLDAVAEFDDEVMEKYLEGQELSEEEIHRCVKAGVNSLSLTPVYMGSAFKNKGVQVLLEAVSRYLPSPLECEKPKVKKEVSGEKVQIVELDPDPEKPLVLMAFKITEDQFGQLTYSRIYQGTLKKGDTIFNTRTKRKVRVGANGTDEF